MERGGANPDKGPVLVSGATGGVGGVATIILSQVLHSPNASQINCANSSWAIMLWLWVD